MAKQATETEKAVEFSEAGQKELQALLARYPDKRAALLMVLHLAQREFGWISQDVMKYIAEQLELPYGDVYDAVSFYTMFHTRPPGKYHLQVCHTLSCALRGAHQICQHIEEKLGIKEGEVTPDGKFSFVKVECLGSCGTAPVVQINEDYHENMTVEKLEQFLKTLK
ncbi:MAG: NAD(P)H-dependent oxidoreductase subunit E [Calditrichaeota bacterium]|nr:MAG: NAD(P)H-dependent oxidoreductase subunit E [Calditrichota bacterium]